MKTKPAAMAVLITVLSFLINGCGNEEKKASPPAQSPLTVKTVDPQLAAKAWREAVAAGKINAGLEAAAKICGKVTARKPAPQLVKLFQANGINPRFINAPFNPSDFQSWQHAFFFQKLARELSGDAVTPEDKIKKLAVAVSEHIKPERAGKEIILWPYNIWHLKKGLCDRQAWVLCELAYQLGFETQIVYLWNREKESSPHTICEIRQGSKVWTADPFSGKLLEQISIAKLAVSPELKKQFWPKRLDRHEPAEHPLFWLPAYPQDYCPKNQILQQKLKLILGKDCPRFGLPPGQRMQLYLSLTTPKDRKFNYDFWFYPFRLLHAEMIKAAKAHQKTQAKSEAK